MSANVDAIVWQRTGTELGGTLPTFAWPGGYPLVYFDADGSELCAKCANARDWSEAHLIGVDAHLEGAPVTCANCNAEIESAYGEPDSDAHLRDCGLCRTLAELV